jgi:gliding motility-associated-like protein
MSGIDSVLQHVAGGPFLYAGFFHSHVKNSFCTVLFFFFSLFLFFYPIEALPQLSAGGNDTINPGIPVTLKATYGLIGNGIITSDDGVEGPFPIGFEFVFFGNRYTQFWVGANGWISFSPNQNAQGTRQAFAIPSAADFNPKNCILGPFQDLNPVQAGSPYIFYQTIGLAPARQLVVMWCECPMYQCQSQGITFQIVLNEATGVIENHIMRKPACPDWLDNRATLGVQDISGYTGFAVPGYNATSWSADTMAWKYTPSSVDSFQISQIPYNLKPVTPGNKISFRWYNGTEFLTDQQELVVSPGETTRYTVYCTICNGQEFKAEVTVFVVPYIPNSFTPNGDGINDRFSILGLPPENITKYNLQIYNRWGQVVFFSNDIRESWDGTLNGQQVQEGVYTWVIYYEDNNKFKSSNKGTILLLR